MTNQIEIPALTTVASGSNQEEVEVVEKTITFTRREGTLEDVPKKRPYRFNHGQLRDLQVGMNLGLNIMITGPTGCGKTSLPIALASHLNQPVIRFNCNGETRVSALVGMSKPAAQDGVLTLQFEYGALVRAMREGYWIIFDEIDAAPPGVLMCLQPVLEEGTPSLHVPETGERIHFNEHCQVFATGNTLGYRASTRASHAGTNVMNAAFLDRFGMVIAADYPTRQEEEARVLVNVPGSDKELVEGICRTAESLRKDKSFRSDFSTRRAIQWARLLPHYKEDNIEDILGTFELAVVRKLTSASDVRVARETVRRTFGYDEQTR